MENNEFKKTNSHSHDFLKFTLICSKSILSAFVFWHGAF